MEASWRCKDSNCNSCTSNSSHLGYKHVKNTGNSQVLTPGSWKRLLPKVLELARVTGDDLTKSEYLLRAWRHGAFSSLVCRWHICER